MAKEETHDRENARKRAAGDEPECPPIPDEKLSPDWAEDPAEGPNVTGAKCAPGTRSELEKGEDPAAPYRPADRPEDFPP
jgi:hypothetical protein